MGRATSCSVRAVAPPWPPTSASRFSARSRLVAAVRQGATTKGGPSWRGRATERNRAAAFIAIAERLASLGPARVYRKELMRACVELRRLAGVGTRFRVVGSRAHPGGELSSGSRPQQRDRLAEGEAVGHAGHVGDRRSRSPAHFRPPRRGAQLSVRRRRSGGGGRRSARPVPAAPAPPASALA